MDQCHCFRALAELLRPVECRVSASNNDDTLTAEFLRIGDAIKDPSSVPGFRASLWQTSRREGPNTAGNDNRAPRKAIGLCNQNEVVLVPLECDHVLIEVRLEMELRCLFDERVHHVLGQNLGEAADIEDVFLGVQRRELTAQLRQGVDNARRCPAHPSVKSGEQSGWTAADNGDVCNLVSHLYCEIYSSGKTGPRSSQPSCDAR